MLYRPVQLSDLEECSEMSRYTSPKYTTVVPKHLIKFIGTCISKPFANYQLLVR